MKPNIMSENLYEIPTCTICLQELTNDLTSLSCGHVFHAGCISQHFEYKGTCPNCQKRANDKQLRYILFPLQLNSNANKQLREMLRNLSQSQNEQVSVLLQGLKDKTEQNDLLLRKLENAQKQAKQKQKQLEVLKVQLDSKKADNQNYRKQCLQLQRMNASMIQQKNKMQVDEINLRNKLETYKKHQRDYEQFKTYKKVMSQNSGDILRYWRQLQNNNTPSEDKCKIFYEMVMIKHLQVLKFKEKILEFPQKIAEKDNQLNKLKALNENYKNQIRDLIQKKQIQRKKYQNLKVKFRSFVDKHIKEPQIDLQQQESNSFGYSRLIKQSSIDEEQKITQLSQVIQQLPESTSRQAIMSKKTTYGGNAFGKVKGVLGTKKLADERAKLTFKNLL